MKTHEEQKKETLSAFRRIRANHIEDYYALIAAAVISGQAMSELPEEEKSKFAGFAYDVQSLTVGEDEPRFCLYDYLDACVNSDISWEEMADRLAAAWEKQDNATLQAIFGELVELAEEKRATYST